jgi:hypothetical protein
VHLGIVDAAIDLLLGFLVELGGVVRAAQQVVEQVEVALGHGKQTRCSPRASLTNLDVVALSRRLRAGAVKEAVRKVSAFLDAWKPDHTFVSEILGWGLVCSDLEIAAAALGCAEVLAAGSDANVPSLAARSLWVVVNGTEDADLAGVYVTAMLRYLAAVAEDQAQREILSSDSALLWIAVESLRLSGRLGLAAFNAAQGLLIAILSHREYLAGLGGAGYGKDRLTPAACGKFHLPWGATFGGGAVELLTVPSDAVDIRLEDARFAMGTARSDEGLAGTSESDATLVIRALNLIAQSGFTDFFHPRVELLVLALLPWFWCVANRDISRLSSDSIDVVSAAETQAALKSKLDPAVYQRLESIAGSDGDSHDGVRLVCAALLPQLKPDEIVLVIEFYTSCLRAGCKHLKLPLYIVAQVVGSIAQCDEVRAALVPFGELFNRDRQDARKSMGGLSDFFAALPTSAVAGARPPVTESEMYERIVAVNTPHLHELSWTEVSMTDLNALPPIVPNGHSEVFADLVSDFRRARLEPFSSWNELSDKMETFLGDTEFESFLARDAVAMHAAMSCLGREPGRPIDAGLPVSAADPRGHWGIFVADPQWFLPSVDDANMVGSEQVDCE